MVEKVGALSNSRFDFFVFVDDGGDRHSGRDFRANHYKRYAIVFVECFPEVMLRISAERKYERFTVESLRIAFRTLTIVGSQEVAGSRLDGFLGPDCPIAAFATYHRRSSNGQLKELDLSDRAFFVGRIFVLDKGNCADAWSLERVGLRVPAVCGIEKEWVVLSRFADTGCVVPIGYRIGDFQVGATISCLRDPGI